MQTLFSKYLAGDCSPEETQKVMAYFDRKEDEKDIRELIRQEFEKEVVIGKVTVDTVADVHKTFADMLDVKEPKRFRFIWPAGMVRSGAAAVWLVLLLSLGTLLYVYQTRSETAGLSETATHSGERKRLDLEDGSVVWLNAVSKLHYPDKFAPDVREVTLEGEAYFEVAEDPDRPFIIRSGELSTTVLGTSFNIRAYKEDKTLAVTVVTGKVKVTAPETELKLTPDEQAVFDKKDGRLNKVEGVSASELTSWKDGELQFRNTTFSEVTATLQRSHNVRIVYDPLLENCPVIHADFNENEPIEGILNMLLISVNGTVEEQNKGEYHLKGTIACEPQNP